MYVTEGGDGVLPPFRVVSVYMYVYICICILREWFLYISMYVYVYVCMYVLIICIYI